MCVCVCVCVCIHTHTHTHIYIPHLLYPFIYWWTGCFRMLTVVNNATVNMGFQLLFPLDVYQAVGLLDHLVVLLFFLLWPRHVAGRILVPRPGIESVSPAVGAQRLNHWTAREVPVVLLLIFNIGMLLSIINKMIYLWWVSVIWCPETFLSLWLKESG